MIGKLILQFVLILLNAFFAATEIAVISLNEQKVRRQAEAGDPKSQKMLKMVEEPTVFLSTIQVGITLAGFLGSAFAADSFADPLAAWVHTWLPIPLGVLETISLILITLILSYFTLIFGELVPKRIAMRSAEKLAKAVSSPISGLSVILRPVVFLLSVSTNGVLRLFGINPKETGEDVSEEDIMDMVDAVEEQGEIDTGTKEMIENIFAFDNITVSDIMVRRTDMSVVSLEATSEEITDMIVESGFSRFPVCGESSDDIVGVLRAREYLLALRENEAITVGELMQKPVFVPDSLSANVLFRRMQEGKTHMVIAVDEYGQTAGLVTMEDLIEEIMGNIYDETDVPEIPNICPEGENTWIVQGNTPLSELEDEIGFVFDEEETESHDTFGGFIVGQLEYIPDEEDRPEVTYKNLSIQVLGVHDKRIESARLTKHEVVEESESDDKEESDSSHH